MKRCLSICPSMKNIIPHKKVSTSYNEDDVFSLCFLIDFSVADLNLTWDMAEDLEDIVHSIQTRYNFECDKEKGILSSWFDRMDKGKQRDLVMYIFNLYKNVIKDPTDKRYMVLVQIYCIAHTIAEPCTTFEYITKYGELKKQINGGI